MNSLDPRIARLLKVIPPGTLGAKEKLDQFSTFEVFVQPKEGKPFQHEGIVHAPNLEMAYVLAKETFTRRFTCVSLYVVATEKVFVSPMTEGTQNIYDLIEESGNTTTSHNTFEIYHLARRGKQHIHAGTVEAESADGALAAARKKFHDNKIIYNVWAIATSDIRFTTAEEKDLWNTLPEKKFRDAGDYKGGEKLKNFLESRLH